MDIVNGWLVYKDNDNYVIDDECGHKYYYHTCDEAIEAAENME